MTQLISPNTNPYTLESLISNLDNRGMLVILVLLGQHAMSLLEKEKVKEVKGTLLPPDILNAEDIRTLSKSTSG